MRQEGEWWSGWLRMVRGFGFEPLGDSAILVHWDSLSKEEANDLPLWVDEIRQTLPVGILDVVQAYASWTIFFDPCQWTFDAVKSWLEDRFSTLNPSTSSQRSSRVFEIPLCFEPSFAWDLDELADRHHLDTKEVVRRFLTPLYRVQMIGFSPGFPYLSGLDPSLATPRRSTPRLEVAQGSVAIGGTQAGIYSMSSPGGWNIIGRTPRWLFDPERSPPSLLRAGDTIRFVEISLDAFEHWKES